MRCDCVNLMSIVALLNFLPCSVHILARRQKYPRSFRAILSKWQSCHCSHRNFHKSVLSGSNCRVFRGIMVFSSIIIRLLNVENSDLNLITLIKWRMFRKVWYSCKCVSALDFNPFRFPQNLFVGALTYTLWFGNCKITRI
jgi:hypothetical protein